MADEKRGLYSKYKVERTDGSSKPGGKHEGCNYFVLDLVHDEFAYAALRAYARACRKQYPGLAKDLRRVCAAEDMNRPCGCRSVGECNHNSFGENGNDKAAEIMDENTRGSNG